MKTIKPPTATNFLKSKKGFTLIELLVVIAIIGILATISVIALQNARAKSRDAKRVGDIKQIQTALELFFNDNNRYPTTAEWNTGKIYSTSTGVTSTYMQVIPLAPTPADGTCTDNQNSISYIPTDNYSSYSISFCIGGNTGTLNSGPKCLAPGGITDADCMVPCSAGTIGGTTCYYAGENYRTTAIGSQVWMAENLNVGTMIGIKLADNSTVQNQTQNSLIEKYCYNYIKQDDAAQIAIGTNNCATYGGLYQWAEAMQYSTTEGAQGICPDDWHIPTDNEITTLERAICTSGTCATDFPYNNQTDSERGTNEGTSLKAVPSSWNGTDSFDLTFLPTGHCWSGSCQGQGTSTHILSSSLYQSGPNFWLRNIGSWGVTNTDHPTIYRTWATPTLSNPVRCLRN